MTDELDKQLKLPLQQKESLLFSMFSNRRSENVGKKSQGIRNQSF